MAASAPVPLFQGVDKGSFAYKLLNKLGWEEGKGLGAQQQGITEHVKVKKKFDALGVGAAEQAHKLRDWTTGMTGFDTVLCSLKEVKASGHGGDSSGDSSDGGSSGEQTSASGSGSDSGSARRRDVKQRTKAITPGASKGPAAAATKEGSKRETKKGKADSAPQGSDEQRQEQERPSPVRVKLATHVGRYARRERAKRVSGYSATDLAAILGSAFSEPPAEVGAQRQDGDGKGTSGRGASSGSVGTGDSGGSSNGSSGGSDSDSEAGAPATAREDAQKPVNASCQGNSGSGGVVDGLNETDAITPSWWGNMFVRAGRVGSGKPAARSVSKARGFLEQDQTDLYNKTHQGATQGRQGLGRADAPKKVAGVRWQGKKTRLCASSDEEGGNEQQPAEAADIAEAMAQEGIVIVGPKRARAADAAVPAAAAPTPTAAGKRDAGSRDKQKGQQQTDEARQDGRGPQRAGTAPSEAAAASAGKKRKASKAAPAEAGGAGLEAKKPRRADGAAEAEQQQRRQQEQQPQQQAGKVKWARVAETVLAAAPNRRMRVMKLHQRALREAGLGSLSADEADIMMQQMLRKLRKAGSFRVCEKYVRLT